MVHQTSSALSKCRAADRHTGEAGRLTVDREEQAMAQYVFTYAGGGPMPETQEARDASMAAWRAWFAGMGAAVVDAGNPFGGSSTVTAAGVADGSQSGVNGYSIVTASDLSGACEMAKGCPILQAGGAVEVHEVFEAM
jgi:hypothetical protein